MVARTYAILIVVLLLLENWLVFQPSSAKSFWVEKPDSKIQDVTATLPDGTKLHGWWLPPRSPELGAVLYCHGNGGNVCHRGPIMLDFHTFHDGVGVLVFDYPGYGKSEGSASEAGCHAAAEAFWNLLTNDLKIDPKRVVILGESLGGGVATELATKTTPRALVLYKTFTSLPAAAKDLYRIFPTNWLMRNRFDVARKLDRIAVPVFIAHGTTDTLVRPHHAEANYAAAREPKALCWMPGAGHNDAPTPGFYRELHDFLAAKAP